MIANLHGAVPPRKMKRLFHRNEALPQSKPGKRRLAFQTAHCPTWGDPLTKRSSQLPAASLQRRKISDLSDSFADQRLTVG